MKKAWMVFFPLVLLALFTAGCYTQFYKPGMEQAQRESRIYNRYDSTAIDTTLMRGEVDENYYPRDDYGWSTWGRPRMPRWGLDFYSYSPDYYWGYNGYNDYYGTPWWYNSYYDPYYPYYPPGSGQPVEPPSKREGGRRQRPSSSGGSATQSPPPAAPTYTPPPAKTPPAPPPASNETDDQNKRSGKRGR